MLLSEISSQHILMLDSNWKELIGLPVAEAMLTRSTVVMHNWVEQLDDGLLYAFITILET